MATIKKNDTIIVITGKDKGKKGRVLRVFPKKDRALVESVNVVKKHMRPTRDNPQGGIASVERPIHISNIMLVCPRCAKGTRGASTILADGTKKRICKKCNEII
jgi:large subunit ribosomal protein L24